MSLVAAPVGALRRAENFDDISEIMGRMALERRRQHDSVPETKKANPVLEFYKGKVVSQQQEIAELRERLQRAEKATNEKDMLIKMLETENKHLSSLVEENTQHFKDMYESAPQKRTSKKTKDSKQMLRSLQDSSNIVPISARMPDNARLGWAVSKAGVVMHRIMIEFSANLNHLDGRKMTLKWSVLRRYSAFEKLAQDLRVAGLRQIPALPPKSWFRVDPRTRQMQLHSFVQKLLAVPGVLALKPLRLFLNLTDEMAVMLPGGSNRLGAKKRSRA